MEFGRPFHRFQRDWSGIHAIHAILVIRANPATKSHSNKSFAQANPVARNQVLMIAELGYCDACLFYIP